MGKEITYFECSHIGVAGTTRVAVKKMGDEYVARCGIAIMGMTNMDKKGFANCNHDPFHDEFYDNYSEGKGKTEEEAIENLKKNMRETADSIWAI